MKIDLHGHAIALRPRRRQDHRRGAASGADRAKPELRRHVPPAAPGRRRRPADLAASLRGLDQTGIIASGMDRANDPAATPSSSRNIRDSRNGVSLRDRAGLGERLYR